MSPRLTVSSHTDERSTTGCATRVEEPVVASAKAAKIALRIEFTSPLGGQVRCHAQTPYGAAIPQDSHVRICEDSVRLRTARRPAKWLRESTRRTCCAPSEAAYTVG